MYDYHLKKFFHQLQNYKKLNITKDFKELEEYEYIYDFIFSLGGLSEELKTLLSSKETNLVILDNLLLETIHYIRLNQMKLIHAIAILKYTQIYNNHFKNWIPLKNELYLQLLKNNINPQDSLFGLD